MCVCVFIYVCDERGVKFVLRVVVMAGIEGS